MVLNSRRFSIEAQHVVTASVHCPSRWKRKARQLPGPSQMSQRSVGTSRLALHHQPNGGSICEAFPIGMLGLERTILVGREDRVARPPHRYIQVAANFC